MSQLRESWRVILAVIILSTLMALAFIGTRTLLVVPENKKAIEKVCEAKNEQNAKQVQLWEFIIALTANNPESQSDPEQLRQFRTFLNDTFPQEQCVGEG